MTEPGGNSEDNLKRVREKVMQLAREIEKMSGEEIAPATFFNEFLVRVVTAIGARAGAVWMLDGGRLALAAENNLEETGIKEIPGALQINEKLLIDVLQTGEARTITHDQETQLPTEHVMVLSAIHKEKDCVGVVQLFQRADVPDKARSGYMQFLEQMCGYASRFVEGKRRNPEMSADLKSKFWTDFEQFSLRIQRSLDESEVSDAAASDGRPLLGCDRLSVVTKKGSKVKVCAVSGQATVNHRANLVQAMRKLTRRVIDSGETLTYTGRIEGLAPQIEKPLANFVQESGSRMLMIVPMFPNEVLVREQGEEAEAKRKGKRPKASGCLVVEQVGESEPAPELEQRAELLADHVGAALWNSRTHGRIFGKSVFKLMGKTLEWFQGKKLAITAGVLLLAAAIVAAMTLIKVEYPVEADGKLMPVEQHAVFAMWDGEIKKGAILATPDADGIYRVKKGQLLLVLENDELNEQMSRNNAEIEALNQKIAAIDEQLLGFVKDVREIVNMKIRRIEQVTELKIAEQLKQTLADRKTNKLGVFAPADGIIPDFKRMEILRGRPVKQGDHLFDVMNDNGPWHMELLVEEKRMGHLNAAREEMLKNSESYELAGQFTVISQVQSKFNCRLTQIASRSTIDPEIGTAYELVAEADKDVVLPTQQIGGEVTARFECGKVSLAFYCFGDVVEFLQRNMWYL